MLRYVHSIPEPLIQRLVVVEREDLLEEQIATRGEGACEGIFGEQARDPFAVVVRTRR